MSLDVEPSTGVTVKYAKSPADDGSHEAVAVDPDVFADCSGFNYNVAKLALFVFGTIGNILALLVMRHQTSHAKSYALTLTVLTALNSLTLFALALDAFDQILTTYSGTFEIYIGDLGCKLYRLFIPLMQMSSHWVVVMVTAERFCAVVFPLSLGRMFTFRGTKIALATLLSVVFLSQTWRLAFDHQEVITTVEGNDTSAKTVAVPTGCAARNMPLYFVIDAFVNQMLLLFLLPALLIITLNSATAWHILHAGTGIRRNVGNGQAPQTRANVALRRTSSTNQSGYSYHPRATTNGHAKMKQSTANGHEPLCQQSSITSSSGQGGAAMRRKATVNATKQVTKFRTRKSIALLMTLSGCFLMCMMPQLVLLLYLRIYHMVYGHEDSFKAFLRICQPLNFSTVLTAMNYADNFLIFLVAGRGFRKRIVDYLAGQRLLKACFQPRPPPVDDTHPVLSNLPSPTQPNGDPCNPPLARTRSRHLNRQRSSASLSSSSQSNFMNSDIEPTQEVVSSPQAALKKSPDQEVAASPVKSFVLPTVPESRSGEIVDSFTPRTSHRHSEGCVSMVAESMYIPLELTTSLTANLLTNSFISQSDLLMQVSIAEAEDSDEEPSPVFAPSTNLTSAPKLPSNPRPVLRRYNKSDLDATAAKTIIIDENSEC